MGGGGKSYSPPAPAPAPAPTVPETDGTSAEQERAKKDQAAREKLRIGRAQTLINGAPGDTTTALTSTPTLLGSSGTSNTGTTT